MNEEISHIAQWGELKARALNFGLTITFDADVFYLQKKFTIPGGFEFSKELGRYMTLADLRAGISDYVAGERAAGRMKI